jgi:hypothetical protein
MSYVKLHVLRQEQQVESIVYISTVYCIICCCLLQSFICFFLFDLGPSFFILGSIFHDGLGFGVQFTNMPRFVFARKRATNLLYHAFLYSCFPPSFTSFLFSVLPPHLPPL